MARCIAVLKNGVHATARESGAQGRNRGGVTVQWASLGQSLAERWERTMDGGKTPSSGARS